MEPEEMQVVDDVQTIYRDLMKVPCTGCNYCMPCPLGVEIPRIFTDYNNKYFFGSMAARINYIGRSLGMMGTESTGSGADQYTGCGKCEQHCPQQINIREELEKAHKELDNPVLRFGLKLATRAIGFRRD